MADYDKHTIKPAVLAILRGATAPMSKADIASRLSGRIALSVGDHERVARALGELHEEGLVTRIGRTRAALWCAPQTSGSPEPTPAEIHAALTVNPMRMLSRLRCKACGHQWQQPKAGGNCPACHGTDVEAYDQQPCMAKRV